MKTRTRTFSKPVILSFTGLLLVIIAAACAAAPAPTSAPEAATAEPATAVPTEALPPATETVPVLPPTVEPTAATGGSGGVSFSRDIQPILEANCLRCHSGSRLSGGVNLGSYETILKVLIPGNAHESELFEVVDRGIMPRGGTPLSAAEIQLISEWIDAGAPNN